MKKIITSLVLSLVVISALLFTGCEVKNDNAKKSDKKPLAATNAKSELEKWEASPDGKMYLQWKASPAGQKVMASTNKISKSIRNFNQMKAVITSLTLPPESNLGYGIMIAIDGDDYILTFPFENTENASKEYAQVKNLKVNQILTIKSNSASHAPKYAYPIISGDYVELDGKVIFKRKPNKNGC
ncbi:hypothetical protein [Flavobacterium sp.]|uniref:hypothetical protein n=1 Tax=Flavobacterium sp. TaxID=239 RepID=UPI0026230C96|nr:hypothetical protein [Flavobacterium sp.]